MECNAVVIVKVITVKDTSTPRVQLHVKATFITATIYITKLNTINQSLTHR